MYHAPVMLQECMEGLNIQPDKIYVDVTFGGGGHAKELLNRLSGGRLIGFDQDKDAHNHAFVDERLTLVKSNFRFLKNFLRMHNALPVAGILADLGVSSHQFDEASRGFSIRFDADLDMRMDEGLKLTAADVLATYSQDELTRIFKAYGELKGAHRIAEQVVRARAESPIKRVEELKALVVGMVPAKKQNQFYAQLFQAIRIEVNGELDALKEVLEQAVEVLEPGGRLVVMSYHSLEDRLVKNWIKTGSFDGKMEKDFYGNVLRPMKPVVNKVIVPTDEEVAKNPRARSAKLRVAEKIDE